MFPSLNHYSRVIVVAASVLWTVNGSAAEPPPQSPDGLDLVKSKNVGILYARPGATLQSYKRVMLDDVEVAFDKRFTRDHREVNANDRERIRNDLAEEFRRVFTEELEDGGYEIAQAQAPDVLRVSAAIVDLYIEAPDTMPSMNRVYTVSAGRMTLIAELRDSESGAILARAADRRSAESPGGTLQWATRSSNRADAIRVLKKWATTLREGLDGAREHASTE
jgi:hypothetical protein